MVFTPLLINCLDYWIICLPCFSSFPKLREAAGHQFWQEQWSSFNQITMECREEEEEKEKEEGRIHFHVLVMQGTVRADGGMQALLKSVKKWVRDAIFN